MTGLLAHPWARALVDLLFPPACGGCGREGVLFCPACRVSLVPIQKPCCSRCARPLSGGRDCAWCARYPLTALDGLTAAYAFAGPLRAALLAFKYRHLRSLAEPLGALLVGAWQGNTLPVDMAVPIPLHRQRERSRGYNQAALLAGALAAEHGMALEASALSRWRDTPPQARARSAEERRAQVQGVFRADPSRVAGRRLLLVDDVCTTGATLDAAAAACREAGATAVFGLVLAREL